MGLALDFYVLLAKVTHSFSWSIGFSALSFMTLCGFWFLYPLAARQSRRVAK